MTKTVRSILLGALLPLCLMSQPKKYEPTWESLDARPIPQWFQDAKFGIFIHWGVYSVPAWSPKGNYSEWYQYWLQTKAFNGAVTDYHAKTYGADFSYYKFADQFKAERFDPDEWADLFAKAGAKYMVLTSKHHDGFALWNSKESSKTWGFPWNAVETGPKRDLLGDLLTAMSKKGIHPGMYFSLYEWFNPLWKTDKERYVREHALPQMYDLINTYKPEVFWTDGDWETSAEVWQSKPFLTWLFNESPVKNQIVVNDRWGLGMRFKHGGIYTPEYQPDLTFDRYFEESRGIGFSYGYNREEDVWDYNSAQVLIYQMCDLVSRGGNFLLDIGPDGHGKIPPIMQERLLDIGKWLSINGDAIYGTHKWRQSVQWSDGNRNYTTKNTNWLLKQTVDPDAGFAVKEAFFTSKNGDLYAILPQWHKTFVLKDVVLKPNTRINYLENNETLKWIQQGKDVAISMPEFDPNKIKSQYAYVLKINQDGDFVSKPTISTQYSAANNAANNANNGGFLPQVSIATSTENASIHYTTDGSEPSLNSPTYTQPFVVNQSATIRAKAFKSNILPSLEGSQDVKKYALMPAKSVRNARSGLTSTSVKGTFNSVNEVVASSSSNPNLVQNISLASAPQTEHYGLVFEGFLKIPQSGLYSLFLESDDGSVLWLDGEKVIDNDGLHGLAERSGRVALAAGFHALKLVYFQGTGNNALKLSMQPLGGAKIEVPASMLFSK